MEGKHLAGLLTHITSNCPQELMTKKEDLQAAIRKEIELIDQYQVRGWEDLRRQVWGKLGVPTSSVFV